MSKEFDSLEAAFMVLSDPSDPDWGEALHLLIQHPETSEMMIETFRETLEQMGVEPSSVDPVTGDPTYSLKDVARAMGIPDAELDVAVEESLQGRDK
jgi:hypothetical protein